MTHKATPARIFALKLGTHIRKRNAYARELIDARRDEAITKMGQREFDFAQVLIFGVVMCAGTLDEFINRNLDKTNDIKPKIRDAMRISAYEMLFLKKDAHIVVNQGVELVRYQSPRAAGLANAVLRKMAKDAQKFPWGVPVKSTAVFARKYAVPKWLASKLRLQYSYKAASKILSACLKPAPTYVRENPYNENSIFPCDLASQQIAEFLPLGQNILEIGAGRGTKTMLIQIRSYEKEAPVIWALDVHAFKAKLLKERMTQEHIPDVYSIVGDARNLSEVDGLLEQFDAVFIDAPCSGTGTLRRHPEKRWQLQPSDVHELSALQFDMLTESSKRVKVGGHLLYASCSIFKEENEDIVNSFLESKTGKDFEIVPLEPHYSEFKHAITSQGYFQSLPCEGGPDGHFAALLKRKGN